MYIDFSLRTLIKLYKTILKKNYKIIPVSSYIQKKSNGRSIILRHDVDKKIENSLKVALIEHKLGIKSSFYFRYKRNTFNINVIKKIENLGHEIGYHYEVLSKTKGNLESGIELFKNELNEFRKIVDIKTICMHGSPLFKWDNRKLWGKYDYHDFGLIGEPYFDIDYNEVLYLTDTGRRWDGESYNVRDRVRGERQGASGEGIGDRSKKIEEFKSEIRNTKFAPLNKISLKTGTTNSTGQETSTNDQNRSQELEERIEKEEEKKIQTNNITKFKNSFHSTNDIIRAAREGRLPEKIMLNVHPQRWNDSFIPWFWELASQNVKNVVKRYFFVKKNS